ncbi:MAG: SAM-dependent chlorinase/fluorinase [Bacteroidales bacterium]
MAIITLISDWGLKDHYAGAVKGTILKYDPLIRIVDITHMVDPFNLLQASFVLRNSYPDFPDGTIHIVSVNTDESTKTPHVAIYHKNHYFIGADNGVFSLAFDETPEKIVVIEIIQDNNFFTFSTRDRFVKAAIHLASGKPIESLGYKADEVTKMLHFKPVVEQTVIKGKVIYIDRYENIFVNIAREVFEKAHQQREFTIKLRNSEYNINTISKSYKDVPPGDILALFSSTGFLEIAINEGNASGLLGIDIDDQVRIEFND